MKTEDGSEHSIEHWDMIIAHPPCTYMTNAGAARMFRKDKIHTSCETYQMVNVERLKQMILARDFFMKFYNADCEMVCIENPVPMSIAMLPKATQMIQPYEFGEPYSKKTYLWLKGLPPLLPTEIVEPKCSWVSGGSKRSDGSQRKNKGMTFRDSERKSKTFKKIAEAMAEQWG